MSDVYIMIGIPGSGKSTYIKKHLTETSTDRHYIIAESEDKG